MRKPEEGEGEAPKIKWHKGDKITDQDIAENYAYNKYTDENKIKFDDNYTLQPITITNAKNMDIFEPKDEPDTEEISFEEILVGKQLAPTLRQYKSLKLDDKIKTEQKKGFLNNPTEVEKKQLEIIKDIVEDNEKQLNFKYDNRKIKLDLQAGEMKHYFAVSAGDIRRYNTLLENKKIQAELQQKIDEQKEKIKKVSDDAKKQIEDQKKAYDNSINSLASKLKDNEKKHQEDIEKSRKEKEDAINKITADKEAQMKTMQEQAKRQIAKEKDDANKKVNDMQNTVNRQITQAKREADEAIKKMKEDNEQRLKDQEAEATQKLNEANNKTELAKYDYDQRLEQMQKNLDDQNKQREEEFEQEKKVKIKDIEKKAEQDWLQQNNGTLQRLNSSLIQEKSKNQQINVRITKVNEDNKELKNKLKLSDKERKRLLDQNNSLKNEIQNLKNTTPGQRVIIKKITPLNTPSFDSGSSGGYAPPPPIDPNYDPLIITSNNHNQEEEEENNVTNNQNTTPQKKSWLVSAIGTLIGVPLSIVGGLGVGDVIEINKGLSIGILAVGAGTAIICIAYDALRTEKPDKQTANNNSTPNAMQNNEQNTTPTKPVNNNENIDNNLETNNEQLLEVPSM